MRSRYFFCAICLACFTLCDVAADEQFLWPDGQKMAISLSYDDAIDSQLDNAIPALNSYGLRGSFYLTLASSSLVARLNEWRTAAAQGHELGNHTIYHPCSAALPDREWVASYYNIDDYQVAEIVHEVTVANSFLHAVDGRTERTYTPPCGDIVVSGESYLPSIRDLFVSIKGFEEVEQGFAETWGLAGVSGQIIVNRVRSEEAKGTKLINIIFHGIGGDYLTTSSEAHDHLLEYLAKNQEIYWIDSYINIMKYVSEERAKE